MVFLLKILRRGWGGGKQVSTNLRKVAATFVLQLADQGGVNQIMLRFLFLLFLVVGFVGSNFNS